MMQDRMDAPTVPSYRGYRFPREIIAHCVGKSGLHNCIKVVCSTSGELATKLYISRPASCVTFCTGESRYSITVRLPMKKPLGKYNVHNKITRLSGTSH
jgi:hypothetical protein